MDPTQEMLDKATKVLESHLLEHRLKCRCNPSTAARVFAEDMLREALKLTPVS